MTPEQWILHRDEGIGWILERGERRSVTARFADGTKTVDGKFSYLDPASLRVLALQSPAELERLVTDDPADVAKRMLLERQPMPLNDAHDLLVKLGCPAAAAATWRDSVRAGAADGEAAFDAGSTALVPAVSPAPEDDTDELIAAVLDGRDDGAAETELRSRVVSGALDGGRASVIGMLFADLKLEINTAEVGEVDAKTLLALARIVTEAEVLLEIALSSNGVKAARKAAERIRELHLDVGSAVLRRLDALLDNLQEATADLERVESRAALTVERVALIFDKPPPVMLSKMFRLAAHRRLGFDDGSDPTRVHGRLDRALSSLKLAEGSLDRVLRNWAGHEAAAVVLVGNSLPLVSDGFRLGLLAAAANGPLAETLARDAAWRGVDLHLLASLERAKDAQIAVLVESPDARPALRRIVARAVSTLDGETLADLVSSPRLAAMADDQPLRLGMERLAERQPQIQRIRRLLAAGPLDAAAEDAASTLAEQRARHSKALAVAEATSDELHAALDSAEERLAHAEEMVRASIRESAAPTEAELRQTWLDAARLASDILAELHRFDASGRPGSEGLLAAEALVAAAGLRRVGDPGEVRAFDPALFRMLSGDPVDTVAVVEAAYVTERFDDVTVVRYGVVRARNEDS